MVRLLTQTVLLFAVAQVLTSCITTQASGPKPKPYPFDHCAVIKREWDEEEGASYRRVYDGYEVLFCCSPCVKAFEINPEAFMGPIREYYGDTGEEGESGEEGGESSGSPAQ